MCLGDIIKFGTGCLAFQNFPAVKSCSTQTLSIARGDSDCEIPYPMMIESWLRLPIYLNGERRFDVNPGNDLTVVDAYDRMGFVFENIEFCMAEGRWMDIEIFHQLEDLGDRIRENDIPPFDQITSLLAGISSRYGFDTPSKADSIWIRHDESGRPRIWIDRDRIVAESNERLFGKRP